MSSSSTPELIKQAVDRFQAEVPALSKLKLVLSLELRGRGDVQVFRVAVPGPEVSKGAPEDARVTVSMPRSHFNKLAADGKLSNYHDAWDAGHIQVTGEPEIRKLIAQVIERQEERGRIRKVR